MSSTYILLTMASYDNSKLIGALGNVQYLKKFITLFDKEMPLTSALKVPLTAHLSTPSCITPLASASLTQTPTPTPPFIITTVEPYTSKT